ncbi:MAG: tripartite tricarboxylate transporter substrate binding protein [Hyphomicrobiales bacterium]
MKTSKFMRLSLVATTILAGVGIAHADFPERPINLVAPFNAGGGTDLLLRALAPHFAEAIGGDAYVSNMAGGSGTVGASALSQQKPDGYQLGYWSVTVSTIQPQIKNVPYNAESWTPICSVAASPTMFFVRDDSPFNSMQDVMDAVNAEPGKYIFGSSGPGAITHLSMVSAFSGLNLMDKVKHLPHKGSGPALKSMASGTIQFFGDTQVLMKRGGLKPLGVFNTERVADFPDVPTMTEVGIKPPLNELYLWGGLFAPAGLDEGIRDKLSAACKTAIDSDGFQEFVSQTGTVINYRNATDFNDFFQAQYEANSTLIDAAGLTKK